MKNIYLFLLISTVMISYRCADDHVELEGNHPESETTTRSSGDGLYDLLGYGYDITGEYGVLGHKYKIFDAARAVQENPAIFDSNYVRLTTQDYTFGSDAYDLTKKLGTKTSVQQVTTANSKEVANNLGQGSRTTTYTYSSIYSMSFATHTVLLKKLDLDADAALLSQYVTTQFSADVNNLTPARLIEKYGTHVLANVHLGGVMKFFYHSKVTSTSTTKERTHQAGFTNALKAITGLNVSFETYSSTTEAKKNSQQSLKVTTLGGVGGPSWSITYDANGVSSETKTSPDAWLSSINNQTAVMIGANGNKMYPIYDFVPAAKRSAIKSAMEAYIRSKQFDIVVINSAIPIAPRSVYGLGTNNQGGGVVVTDVNKNGKPDIFLMGNDNNKSNRFWYRVAFDVDFDGTPGSLSPMFEFPTVVSNNNHGAAIALGDIDKNGKDDIVFMALDQSSRGLDYRYVVAYDLKTDGSFTRYSQTYIIKADFGTKADGAGIALYDVNGNGTLDMLLMQYDAPSNKQNQFAYKIHYDLLTTGQTSGRTSPLLRLPNTFSSDADGAGITVGNIDNNPRPEIILTAYDDADGENSFKYMVLHNIDSTGNPATISPFFTRRGGGSHGEGADGQLCDMDGNGIPDIIFMCIDNPTGANRFRYLIGHDFESNGELGYIR